MTWDIASGAKVEVSTSKKRKWTDKTHRWALTTIRENEPNPLRDWIRAAKRRGGELLQSAGKRAPQDQRLQFNINITEESLAQACRFLRKMNLLEDRRLVEKLLTDTDFSSDSIRILYETPPSTNFSFYVYVSSYRRLLADQILAEWDGKLDSNRERGVVIPIPRNDYFFLGKISGTVTLPCPPTLRDGLLWIYLIPAKVSHGRWPNQPPVHRLLADLEQLATIVSIESLGHKKEETGYKLGTSMPFRIDGVTPGNYRLKAVWDKSYPFAVPGPGDYESGEEPSIEVVAGKSVENLTVVCTNLFKSK